MPGRPLRRCVTFLVVTLLIAAWSPARHGWTIRVLDPSAAAPRAVEGPSGTAFAEVHDGSRANVVTFARLDHGVVRHEPVSTETIFLGPGLPAFDSQGSPWVAYRPIFPSQLILRHRTAGGTWEVAQTIEDTSPVAFMLAPDGTLALLYFPESGPLVYATYDPTSNTLDPTPIPGSESAYYTASLAFDPSGAPAVALLGDKLAYAEETGGAWTVTELGRGSPLGDVSLAFDATGAPCIAYTYQSRTTDDHDLRFARREADGAWTHQTVDGAGYTGNFPSLGFLPDGRAVIAYEKRWPLPNRTVFLEFAVQTPTGWDTEHVDAVGDAQGRPSLIVMASGSVGVAYPSGGGVKWAVKTFG